MVTSHVGHRGGIYPGEVSHTVRWHISKQRRAWWPWDASNSKDKSPHSRAKQDKTGNTPTYARSTAWERPRGMSRMSAPKRPTASALRHPATGERIPHRSDYNQIQGTRALGLKVCGRNSPTSNRSPDPSPHQQNTCTGQTRLRGMFLTYGDHAD